MSVEINENNIESLGEGIQDLSRPLKQRYRDLFTLKNIGGKIAIDSIVACITTDPSALFKHECAYVLGQMQNSYALPALIKTLSDPNQDVIVRHEAGEAIGAIGEQTPEVIAALTEHLKSEHVEISETCQIALDLLEWKNKDPSKQENLTGSADYKSVDPAPPSVENDINKLREILLDEKLSLFERYRAMFALRNIGSSDAVLALADGLKCSSALYRHEIAYILGQMQHEAASKQLAANLMDLSEHAMVRHECAEALGAIATEDCMNVLKKYATDKEQMVKESCEVALDMGEYHSSDQFQYADGLS
ncbi:unnamed protein product [Owenia fusiformis]|uniref:Deoxyhypusine hydroxylase n=1 Tax=Owenia fusiformis TaxID=6347 RepID=A0A8S4NQQ3_OWEFU|nr:unnamed protein product [Owenia fusiformis]